jgi:hypothetical protein
MQTSRARGGKGKLAKILAKCHWSWKSWAASFVEVEDRNWQQTGKIIPKSF